MKVDPLKTQIEALFEVVLDTVSDAITVIDKDLKVIFQNEAVHKMYGSKIGERCFEAYRGRQEPCENCIIPEVGGSIPLPPTKNYKGLEGISLASNPFFCGFSNGFLTEFGTTVSRKLKNVLTHA